MNHGLEKSCLGDRVLAFENLMGLNASTSSLQGGAREKLAQKGVLRGKSEGTPSPSPYIQGTARKLG